MQGKNFLLFEKVHYIGIALWLPSRLPFELVCASQDSILVYHLLTASVNRDPFSQ